MKLENKFYSANFGFEESFTLELENGEIFLAEKVLRLIPRRRIVVLGKWQGQEVVAKIFFDKKRRFIHVKKELKGIKALIDNKIPTPALLLHAASMDTHCQVLIFVRVTDSQNLYDIWHEKKHISEVLLTLHAVITEIATQHVLGIVQNDLHLKNFLITEKEEIETKERVSYERIHVCTLDGGQIKKFPPILPKTESMENLALFLSQLGVGVESYQLLLFRYYAKQRGWVLKRHDISDLFALIKKVDELRWQNYQKKIFRTSSDFIKMQDFKKIAVIDRRYATPQFLHFIHQPEALFIQGANFLKRGNSATVIKVMLDGKAFVIKRYNMKNMFHWLRRALRESRASSCWRFAQKLKLFFVKTAEPIAFIEQRFLGLRTQSYYVTEYIEGEHVGDYFKTHANHPILCEDLITRIIRLLKSLIPLRLTHGDLKMTNLLLDKNLEPTLIDLDGMKEHDNAKALKRIWHKEVQRLLKNFEEQQKVKEGFERELG